MIWVSPTEQQNGRENMLENTNLSRRTFLGASGIAAALGLAACGGGGSDAPGETCMKLRETLTGIQLGEIEAPRGWIVKV